MDPFETCKLYAKNIPCLIEHNRFGYCAVLFLDGQIYNTRQSSWVELAAALRVLSDIKQKLR